MSVWIGYPAVKLFVLCSFYRYRGTAQASALTKMKGHRRRGEDRSSFQVSSLNRRPSSLKTLRPHQRVSRGELQDANLDRKLAFHDLTDWQNPDLGRSFADPTNNPRLGHTSMLRRGEWVRVCVVQVKANESSRSLRIARYKLYAAIGDVKARSRSVRRRVVEAVYVGIGGRERGSCREK
ncbi:hypothetical protein C8J56DRAFT_880771 [Mycena floridula]|nr:hypothetical protein C8J56DRAFT_880771 [Mycena floridula]